MSLVSHHVQHAANEYKRGGNPIIAAWLKQAAIDIWAHGEPCPEVDEAENYCDHVLCPHLRLAIKMADDVMGVKTV